MYPSPLDNLFKWRMCMGIKACNPMVTNFNFVLTQFCSATSKLSSWIWKDMLLLDELVCSTRNAWNSQHGRQRLQYSIKLFEMQGSSSSGLTGLPQKESDNISGTFYRFQCLCAQSKITLYNHHYFSSITYSQLG